MTKIKLTALPILIFSAITLLVSCHRDDIEPQSTYSKSGLVMSGAQEVPANPSPAIGSMDVSYSKLSRTLTYKVTWSGLTDSLSLMHIHGLAPAGFNASPAQNIVASSSAIFPQKTGTRLTYTKSGSISGSLFIDGVAIKEADLLAGMYYMNIHTNGVNPNGGTYGGGEIRAQIVFK
jgi:CHRD domain